MNNVHITSRELRKKNTFSVSIRATEFSKSTFWYYTSLDTAKKILENECIFVSSISEMNDLDEADLHKRDMDSVHCLCFCNSNTEKIPMWYLYAGITGNGISFGLTPSVMLSFIKSIESVSTVGGHTILRRGKDFDIDWGWVFYRKKDYPSQVMYRGKWYSVDDPKSFADSNYYIKSYPWEYEKEFRIVIHNKTSVKDNQLLIDISPILSKIKVKLAPELSNTSLQELMPYLKKLSTDPQASKLNINMNLCKRNYKSFCDYLRGAVGRGIKNQEVNVEEICEIIQHSVLCRNIR